MKTGFQAKIREKKPTKDLKHRSNENEDRGRFLDPYTKGSALLRKIFTHCLTRCISRGTVPINQPQPGRRTEEEERKGACFKIGETTTCRFNCGNDTNTIAKTAKQRARDPKYATTTMERSCHPPKKLRPRETAKHRNVFTQPSRNGSTVNLINLPQTTVYESAQKLLFVNCLSCKPTRSKDLGVR